LTTWTRIRLIAQPSAKPVAMPKPARALRWSCSSLPCAGSDSAAWPMISCFGANLLGLASSVSVRLRKKVTW
jgi:hypothetical protein